MKIDYTIVFSQRRTLTIRVKEGKVEVRAPLGTDPRRIKKAVEDHREWVLKTLAKQEQDSAEEEKESEEVRRERVRLAKEILPVKTDYFARKMGIKYGRITITSAKTRFGSCSSKGNIAYSYRLMAYPDEAIDYVVVHELAHRLEMNHSERFYRIVASVLPDYRERRKLLKKSPVRGEK